MYLATLFGNIPLQKSKIYNRKMLQSSQTEIYQALLDDYQQLLQYYKTDQRDRLFEMDAPAANAIGDITGL